MPKVRRVDFYPDDWLAGTVELDDAERGLYITICALIYSRGGPIDIEVAKAFSNGHGHTFNRCLRRLQMTGKLSLNDSQIVVKRCANELQRAVTRQAKATQNAARRWNSNDLADAGALQPSIAPGRDNQQPTYNKKEEDSPPSPPKVGAKRSRKVFADETNWQPGGAHFELAGSLGQNDAWVADEAERYRDWHANAKHRGKGHVDLDRGFRNWLKERHAERKPKLSAVGNLSLGAMQAADNSRQIAALVANLLQHYWTAQDPPESRRMQIRDWLTDLDGFSAERIDLAFREWRRTQTRRPCPAEILAMLNPPPKFTEAAHKLLPRDERALDEIADERRRVAPGWGFVRRAMMGEDPDNLMREFRDAVPEEKI